MDCIHCKASGDDVITYRTDKHSKTKAFCKICRNHFVARDVPKILLFDIETSRIKFQVNSFRTGEQYVGWKNIKEKQDDWFILSWAGKWLFHPDTFGDVVTPAEAKKRNDKRIAKSLHKIIREADFVIAHNGDKFDIRKINWRFLLHGLEPATRYQSIDTLKKSRQVFGATSHAMDYLCWQLGYDTKHETDRKLWEDCEAGDQLALKRMYEYNSNDTYMLEDLYVGMRGWMKTHPNFAVFTEMYQTMQKYENMCPRCLQVINDSRFTKRYTTPAGYKYASCNCPHCGTMLRKTQREGGQTVKVR